MMGYTLLNETIGHLFNFCVPLTCHVTLFGTCMYCYTMEIFYLHGYTMQKTFHPSSWSKHKHKHVNKKKKSTKQTFLMHGVMFGTHSAQ